MGACPVEVVKVGGSLLDRSDLLPALDQWLGDQDPNAHRVLVVGGGRAVDGLRRLHELLPLDPPSTHWHAIRLMDLTGGAIGLGASWPVLDSWEQLQLRCANPGITQFLAEGFLRDFEPLLFGTPLTAGWQVTSDSIAARIAICLGAGRLVLLKSRPATLAEQHDWTVAAREGLVDAFFPHLAPAIPEVEFHQLPARRELKS